MKYKYFFNIADVCMQVTSDSLHERNPDWDWKLESFILKESDRVDTEFKLKLTDRFVKHKPHILFETRRTDYVPSPTTTRCREMADAYLGVGVDWRVGEYDGRLLFEGGGASCFQLSMDKDLRGADINLIKNGGRWELSDLVYSFMQLYMIFFLGRHQLGLMFHAAGVRDDGENGQGLLFAGSSGAGKTTAAKIWHKYGCTKVLNDDRIIIRKVDGDYYMYSTPWHGDYYQYFNRPLGKSRVDKMFCLYHRETNKAMKLTPREGFTMFFKTIFPLFYDKESMEFSSKFLLDLVAAVPSYSFGFKNDSGIMDYVRKIQ
ncbi:hypothetical protein GF374_03750 [Candidatus Woesearchaeota archaeon]|nr:hypothetical protein [Candidatus Woesearchaeota archaeon]